MQITGVFLIEEPASERLLSFSRAHCLAIDRLFSLTPSCTWHPSGALRHFGAGFSRVLFHGRDEIGEPRDERENRVIFPSPMYLEAVGALKIASAP
jgi:hypothetical protein